MSSAFFYGTLMHPKILQRVIGNDGAHLQICPAVLLQYTRHCVKDADYPGILPYSSSRAFFSHDISREECSVRGTLVTGLTAADLAYLDLFEGSEYTREQASVHPLSSLLPLSEYSIPEAVTPLPADSDLSPIVEVETYVYKDISGLIGDIWDFDDFVRTNAWKWYGNGARQNPDFTEVDRRQAASRG
ncbi:hypothetical protein FB45DRAFT_887303 [Roridomyces roridus]|uniref:Putative gamma-glutamylcyclotransferase n=1 Tax=Roridomyces roridus TaxID=1738132 RepID=A0AAD7G2A7_9AGAR|nr:hypothetical protein FB45DRAFT_887303 [Roridomyces roridus]